jgi:hypothetical protein
MMQATEGFPVAPFSGPTSTRAIAVMTRPIDTASSPASGAVSSAQSNASCDVAPRSSHRPYENRWHLGRRYLKGREGDAANVVLSAGRAVELERKFRARLQHNLSDGSAWVKFGSLLSALPLRNSREGRCLPQRPADAIPLAGAMLYLKHHPQRDDPHLYLAGKVLKYESYL